jgi:recombination protein RecA
MSLDIVERIVHSGQFGLVVVDSVAALVPKEELEGQMGDSNMGLAARLMSQAMRKLTGIIGKSKCTVIFINQLRDLIGIVWGQKQTTTGGNALKFYSSIRLEIVVIGKLKNGEEIYGNRVRVKVTKNKVSAPFKKAEFDMIHGLGISKSGEILDLAVEMELVKKSGSWFSCGDTKLGQGRENVIALMNDNVEMMNDMESKIKAIMFKED